MAVKKTPGPMMQKLKARVNRTKDIVGSKTKKAGELAKQEARVVTRDFTTRYEDRNVNASNAENRQARVSARRAERTKRIADRNSTGRPVYRDGQQVDVLDRRKRVAREQLISTFSENTLKYNNKKELNKIADRHRADIMNKPRTDAEKRKRDAKLQKRAVIGNTSIGAGTGSGVSGAAMQNVCPVNAMSGGNKGTCKPRPSKSASPSSSKGMVTKKPMMKSTKK